MGHIEHYPSDISAGFLCMTWTGFRFFCGIFSDIVWIVYWTLLAFWITLLDYPFCFDAWIYRFPVADSLTVFSFTLTLSPVPRTDPVSSGAGGAPLQNISPTTDPAELREIIVRQDSLIRAFQAQLEALTAQLSSATAATPRESPIARGESPRLALPDKFDGSADRCRGFLRQCGVFFSHQPGMYSEDGTKCAFLLSLFTGKALEWASVVWDADPLIRASYSHFEEAIREVFEHPAGGKDIPVQLMEIRQGSDSAADYAIRFRTLAVQSEWNDAALWAVFRAGLWKPPPFPSLWLLRFVSTTCGANAGPGLPTWPLPVPASVWTAMGRAKGTQNPCSWGDPALIDSGAAVNLIDGALVEELGISTSPCVPSLRITAIDSQPIGEGYLRRQTEPLGLQVGLFHHERLTFYITSSPANPVILGFPWLRRHDPQISWRTGELTHWSPA
ncbi:hypothetical protein QTP70_020386 [Hemibagrus guttatus]|uniref:Retrotransposon gag domain-containing protein n=1 Tax=Hemibagrus guttatus TaxID=175788 RepID=A0AAE0UJR7_9TELE|nr:hypothetical protein QTP70_020386 [Hemibagrus guttatus]